MSQRVRSYHVDYDTKYSRCCQCNLFSGRLKYIQFPVILYISLFLITWEVSNITMRNFQPQEVHVLKELVCFQMTLGFQALQINNSKSSTCVETFIF